MCGIAGIYNPEGLFIDKHIIGRMSWSIRHRGPDAEGYHFDSHAHMASRRLSIIDLNQGAQPIYSRDKKHVIVYNGEIYNYREVKKKLLKKGFHFTTDTDTEVILAAFLAWGEDSLSFLRGMFAFCIWNYETRELFLARDRLGIKPLYYALQKDGTFIFASEVKALLLYPGIKRELYPKAINNLLTFGFNTAPFTFFNGIKQVLPGHFLNVSKKGLVETEYWDIDLDSHEIKDPPEEIAIRLREEISRSVKSRLIADVPIAAYLSGGIDSSIITGMYSGFANKIKTISINFDHAGYDESEYSREVSRAFKTEHVEFKCEIEDDRINDLVYYMEDPLLTLLNLPLFLLSEKASQNGFKVVLSGDGADEIFGGYDYFRLLKVMRFIRNDESAFRKNLLRRIFPKLKNFISTEIQYLFLKGYSDMYPALPYKYMEFPFKYEMYSGEYLSMLSKLDFDSPFFFDLEKISRRSFIDQALYIEIKMRLLNLTLPLADKMSMANSVELRTPFLDHDLVNFAFRIPDKYKIRGLNEKYILKKSMQGFLPERICKRKKQPLQPPGRWFINAHYDLIRDYLSDAAVRSKGYFNPDFIQNALCKYNNEMKIDYSGVVIVAFFIHLWDEIFLRNKVGLYSEPEPADFQEMLGGLVP